MKILRKLILLICLAVAVFYFFEKHFSEEVKVSEAPSSGFVSLKQFDFNSENSIDEWDDKILAKQKTLYSLTEYENAKCLKAESTDSASTLYHKVKLEHEKFPVISWKWMPVKFPKRTKPETLDKKREFDFVAQIYVVFYSKFFLNAKAIQYVWTETIPEGSVSDSPYTKNVKIYVLRSGHSDEWVSEKRDICEDYQMLFGDKLTKDVDAVAFMTDSDSTDSYALAYYDDLALGYKARAVDSAEAVKPRQITEGGFLQKIKLYYDKILSKIESLRDSKEEVRLSDT